MHSEVREESLRFQGWGFRGLGFRVQGLGLRVQILSPQPRMLEPQEYSSVPPGFECPSAIHQHLHVGTPKGSAVQHPGRPGFP